MVNDRLYFFLKDFIGIIQEKYDEALKEYNKAETIESKEIYQTTYITYWIVLDKLRFRLIAFNFEEEFGNFVPELGKSVQ